MSNSSPNNDVSLSRAYLNRLGVEDGPVSVEQLFAIHRRQVERVPYETLWIAWGDRCDIDPPSCFQRIATGRRGGYCFILNGGLGELLRALDYHVVRHVGAVHGPAGLIEGEIANHLVLTVHDLPTAENPDGIWYVDAGLGDALHEPLPLIPGSYRQGPFEFVLERRPSSEFGDWHFRHDPAGSFTGMVWSDDPARGDSFDAQHAHLSTSPDSGFVRVLTVYRRYADAVDILRGLVLRRIGSGASETILETQGQLFEVLETVFDLDASSAPESQRAVLWQRVYESHLSWEQEGRPQ